MCKYAFHYVYVYIYNQPSRMTIYTCKYLRFICECIEEAGTLHYESCAASTWVESASYPNSHINLVNAASRDSIHPFRNRVALDFSYRRKVAVVSINAQNFLPDSIHEQYSHHRFLHETIKAYSGFTSHPTELLQGAWPVVTCDWYVPFNLDMHTCPFVSIY